MDLTYPPAVASSLDRLSQTLGQLTLADETEACGAEPELWATAAEGRVEPAASPLAQFAEFRVMGAYALPLPELLARAERSYLLLPAEATAGSVALAWPDATAPWHPDERLMAELSVNGTVSGSVNVAPFCVPARSLAFLAQTANDLALVECGPDSSRFERTGDAFAVTFEATPARVLARRETAVRAWERAVLWERLALVGLTAGLIDRAWRIALDALGEGQRQGSVVAGEQVAQFQLSDNYIDLLAAERLGQDVALDAERGRAVDAKLALVRYSTSGQAERCAARALHLASLLLPSLVPVARWLTRRAHHLSVYGVAREHEVRAATAGLAAGLRLD